jgi:hypothetical protein
MASRSPTSLERLLEPGLGEFSVELSRHLLSVRVSDEERTKMKLLSERARQGTLTEDEQAELDEMLVANNVLMILQAKARSSLKHSPAA